MNQDFLSDHFIGLDETARVTSKSKSGIYETLKPGSTMYDSTFPRQVKIGKRRVAWSHNAVQEWIQSKINR